MFVWAGHAREIGREARLAGWVVGKLGACVRGAPAVVLLVVEGPQEEGRADGHDNYIHGHDNNIQY